MLAAFVVQFWEIKDNLAQGRTVEIAVGFVFAFLSALVVVKPEIAKSLKRPRVAVLGAGEAIKGQNGGEIDLMTSGAAIASRQRRLWASVSGRRNDGTITENSGMAGPARSGRSGPGRGARGRDRLPRWRDR